MAYARDIYSGNGSNTNFAITFPYLNEDHIQVYVSDVIKVAGVDYTFPDSTHILFTSAPASGTNNVEFRRYSGQDPLVDFADAGGISEADLDTSFLQALYVAQEAYDATVAANTALIGVADLTDMTA